MESLLKGLSKSHHAVVPEYQHLKWKPRAHFTSTAHSALPRAALLTTKAPEMQTTTYLTAWTQNFLKFNSLLFFIKGPLVVIIGYISQDKRLLGNWKDSTLHGGHLLIGPKIHI